MSVHRRLSRCRIAVLVVLSLLFSQITLANYLCPAEAASPAMAEMAPGTPCQDMDADQPVLCHQHLADSGQVVQPVHDVAPSLPALIQVLTVPAVLRALDSVAIPEASTPEAQPPPDPVFLSTLRLRV